MRTMRIRLKLLALLLLIALVPVIAVTWYELRATRELGLELSSRARHVLEERGIRQLLHSARSSAELALREHELLEAAARLQAQAIEAALAGRAPAVGAGRSGSTEEPASSSVDNVAVDFRSIAVIAAPRQGGRTETIIAGLVPQLAELRRDYAPYALWQRIALQQGRFHAVYPAPTQAMPADQQAGRWVREVLERGDVTLLPPSAEAGSDAPVVTVAAPIRAPAGEVIGATAIEVPLGGLIGRGVEQVFRPARVQMAQPDHGRGIRVIGQWQGDRLVGRDVFYPAAVGEGVRVTAADMESGRSGVQRVDLGGEATYWAYAPIDGFGTNLLLVMPYGELVADALTAQDYLFNQLADRRMMLWLGMLVFVPAVIGLAFFASRAVTRPVSQLAEAARKLADGNFSARTSIRSGDELEELGRLFNEMVPQLEASMHMRDSLHLAQEVQQNLLPHRAPDVPGFDIYGVSLYCDETGGDYFDFMPLPALGPSTVAVMIGDVAGHGIAAALLMTTARALLRAREPRPGHLAERVGEVNRHLCRDAHAGRFMTLFLAILDADAQRIHWVGAGHGNGFIYDPAQEVFMDISGPDIPMGVDPSWAYEELAHTGWSPGTVMLVGTDGIWETRNAEGAMFGKPAVRRVIRANADRSATEIADRLIEALKDFRGAQPQVDDVTMIVVKAV